MKLLILLLLCPILLLGQINYQDNIKNPDNKEYLTEVKFNTSVEVNEKNLQLLFCNRYYNTLQNDTKCWYNQQKVFIGKYVIVYYKVKDTKVYADKVYTFQDLNKEQQVKGLYELVNSLRLNPKELVVYNWYIKSILDQDGWTWNNIILLTNFYLKHKQSIIKTYFNKNNV